MNAPAEPVALSFDPLRHEYRVGGQVVPSVTQILAPIHSLAGIPPDVLERKREIGEAVHAAAAIETMGDELDPDSIAPEIEGYLEAWRRFVRERNYRPLLVEARVYHRVLRYAGTLDDAGEFDVAAGVRCVALLDKKCTFSLAAAVGPQTAAYLAAAHDCGVLPKSVKRRFAVHLKPDGRYDLPEFTESSDFAVFQSCLTVLNFKRRHKLQ